MRRVIRQLLGVPELAPPVVPPLHFAEQFKDCVQFGNNTQFLQSASYSALPNSPRRVRVRIGSDCMIDCTFVFESDEGEISIGDRTFVNTATKLIARSGIRIGSDVMIGWNCQIYDNAAHSLNWHNRQADLRQQIADHRMGLDPRTHKDWTTVSTSPITIADKAWLGFDVVVFKGVTVGEGAIVGARSVITRDVAPWTIVAGSPARYVRDLAPEECEA